MNKPVVVHVITNFAGVGGAEMMLSRWLRKRRQSMNTLLFH